MQLVTISYTSAYSEERTIWGVFESLPAALERMKLFNACLDSGEAYHIEVHSLVTYNEQKKRTADILKQRAKYQKANAS